LIGTWRSALLDPVELRTKGGEEGWPEVLHKGDVKKGSLLPLPPTKTNC
jgi:hypothetical protein